ncbi:phosphodiester glycosidase family protein [uncultured Chryseobacterium sp.]|uniref:phosphodiester glycosidase family protein n=1 Tax=uncultured Chryseobacterium sp. TaxID=259322 RepID=UPI002585263C|nr:phosphodiester glycosidase family protein [uncultured Chryseobacterium sp.]
MTENSIPFSRIKNIQFGISAICQFSLFFLIFLCMGCKKVQDDDRFITYQVNPEKQNIQMFWKNSTGEIFKSIDRLNQHVQSKNEKLRFAMNAGMFEPDNSPKGLFIEDYKILKSIDTLQGTGNFYLQPNGILYITQNKKAGIVETKKYRQHADIRYATQSGPMLIINGKINTLFQKRSKNLNIRNGVGILENGELIFAMSKKETNFYDMAEYFKRLGCKEALYLDGYVSRTYLPEKDWMQKDGNFGVMIGVTESSK